MFCQRVKDSIFIGYSAMAVDSESFAVKNVWSESSNERD